MIKQVFEKLFTKISPEEADERGVEHIQYAGKERKTHKFSTTITIPVTGTIETNVYMDEIRNKMSSAKEYEINYDRKQIEKAIADQMIAVVAEVTQDDINISQRVGSTASIGFVLGVANKAMEKHRGW